MTNDNDLGKRMTALLKKLVVGLLDENRKTKAAFRSLRRDYANDVDEFTEHERSYCGDCCPLIGKCPFKHEPSDACNEEIFKWYVENAND